VAVVGVGHLGRIHARILKSLSGFELVAVVDPVESNRLAAATEHRTLPLADHRDVIGRVDAAIVATPTRFHHAVARDLLQAGIHLFIEKPLAATADECDHLVDLARRADRVLQVGHVERFNPAWSAARPHLEGARYIEAVRAGVFSFRSTDIGAVLDIMIHDLDLVLDLVQCPVCRVEALGVAVLGRHEDAVNARLTFANGCVATLSASRLARDARRLMHVWTSAGFMELDFAARTAAWTCISDDLAGRRIDVEQMSPLEKDRLKSELFTRHLRRDELPVPSSDAITAELADFHASLTTGVEPRVPGMAGRDAVALALAILGEVHAHAWDGNAASRRGPLAPVRPGPERAPLSGPHWHVGASRPADLGEART
jgi:predicted dehydrogenase